MYFVHKKDFDSQAYSMTCTYISEYVSVCYKITDLFVVFFFRSEVNEKGTAALQIIWMFLKSFKKLFILSILLFVIASNEHTLMKTKKGETSFYVAEAAK